MIKCEADLIEAGCGWQAEFSPFVGLVIITTVYPTKEKCVERTKERAKKLNIEITKWNE